MMVVIQLHRRLLATLTLIRVWLSRVIWQLSALKVAGQAFLEYALVLAVVAVIVLVALQAFGLDLTGVFDRIRARLVSVG